jgi:hypothetical protein
MFDKQEDRRAFSRALAKTGNRMAARIAIIAMTTRSSMSVNPFLFIFYLPLSECCDEDHFTFIRNTSII